MFRASSAHLKEDTVAHMQHKVLSLSMRVLGGLSVHSLSENWLRPLEWELTESVRTQAVYRQATKNSQRVTVPYAACAQLYPPEDEHLRLETCRGEYYFMNK